MNKAVIILFVALFGVSAAFVQLSDSSRITNGNEANFVNFPFSVSLQRVTGTVLADRGHRCGGVLFTFQHALTAASCVFEIVAGSPVPINVAQYRVFGGASSLTADTDQGRVRTIANVTVHPEYIPPPASINNIAIITLTSPFPNTTISPIALPVQNFVAPDFSLCQIASWGYIDATATLASTNLRYTSKYIYNQNLCTMLYSGIPYLANIFDTMICAASYDIVSSGCTGDEGAALICSGGLTGIMFQTNQCAVSSFPEVYTRVSNYTTWIRSISGSSTIRPELTFFAILAVITAKFLSKA
ncbi:chymotrypsin-like protease CTRL-1 [Anticarsia gemmatalis]|uniref:chymotrypsin-like protease CTRL-1 n=1 Tax=Anticarsia gemmatalis TaxID=129554 RepID=UPI003F76806A